MQQKEETFMETVRNSILILVFEFIGSFFLALLYNNLSFYADYTGFLLGLFSLIIFSAKISGSHYNPAVTVAFMMRKDTGRFSRILGLAYIVFQVGGAFCGCLIGLLFNSDGGELAIQLPAIDHVFQAIVSEAIGTFLLVFLYLTQTEMKTKISADPAITAIIIAASYLASLILSAPPNISFACLNPAIGFSTTIVMSFYKDGTTGLAWIWVYVGFPFAGSIIAAIFHELVYKKVQDTLDAQDQLNYDGLLDGQVRRNSIRQNSMKRAENMNDSQYQPYSNDTYQINQNEYDKTF